MVDLLGLVGVGQRTATFRFDVLDLDLVKIGDVAPDRGSPPSVAVNVGSTTKRGMSGLLLAEADLAAINPLADRLRPSMVLSDGSAYPLGVFLFADLSTVVDTAGDDGAAVLVDMTFILDQGFAHSWSAPTGRLVTDCMADVVAATPLPAAIIDPSGVRLGSPRTWPPGTTPAQILTDLATLAAFHGPYLDNRGALRLRAVPNMDGATADLAYGAAATLLPVIRGSIVRSDGSLTTPNRWTVIDTSPTASPIVGIYDVPPEVPHSAFSRGFVYAADPLEVQGLPDVDAANEAARAHGQQQATVETIRFNSAPNPVHDHYDLVSFDGSVGVEESWSLTLTEGAEMTHELRRSYVLA